MLVQGRGFEVDDGASLLVAFKGLQAESVEQAKVHLAIATDLDHLILRPFTEWAAKHEERVEESRRVLLDDYLEGFEQGKEDVIEHRLLFSSLTLNTRSLHFKPPT